MTATVASSSDSVSPARSTLPETTVSAICWLAPNVGANLLLERSVSRQHDDLRLARCTALPTNSHRIYSHRGHGPRGSDHGLPLAPLTAAAGVAEVDWPVACCWLAAFCCDLLVVTATPASAAPA